MSVHAHHDLADSMMQYGRDHAEELKAHRPMVTMQGRSEQGWTARRCSPEMAVYDPTEDDQSNSADADVIAWLFKTFVIVLLALFSAWCIANYLAVARV